MKAWRLAWLRLRRRATGLGSAIMLIAVAQGVVVLVFAAQSTVESQAVSERVSALAGADRWLSVATGDARANLTSLGLHASASLHRLSGQPVVAHLTLGALSDRRFGRYQLLASSALADEVQLQSGRWPNSCTAIRCEVIRIGSAAFRPPATIAVVGNAEFRPDSALALGVAGDVPLLIAADPMALLRHASLRAVPHTMQWMARLDPRVIQSIGIAGFLQRLVDESDRLSLINGQLQLVAPTTQLAATADQVRALERRMLGLTLCLVLITMYSVHRIALARRPDHERMLRLIREFTWTHTRQLLFSLHTALQATSWGVIAGTVLGGTVGVLVFGSPLAIHSDLFFWTIALALSSLVVALAALVGSAVGRSFALSAIALTWLTFALNAGYDMAVLVLSVAGALVAAAVAHLPASSRLRPFTLDMRRANLPRLRSLTIVTGFLFALVISSSVSLETLRQGVTDHAIFESPLATRVVARDRLPLQDRTLADYERLARGGKAYPVHTVSVSVRQSVVTSSPTEILAVDPAVWSTVPELQGQTGLRNSLLAAAVRQPVPTPGIPLHRRTVISGRVQGLAPTVAISLWLLSDREAASSVRIPLGADGRFRLPVTSEAFSILGFSLEELPDAAAHRAHAVGEGTNTLTAPAGTVRITELAADGGALALGTSLPNSAGVQSPGPGQLDWSYALIGGQAWAPFTRAPTDIRAVVDPVTAGLVRDGVLAVRLTDAAVVPIRVSAVAQRIPTTTQRFILLDPSALNALLAQYAPQMLRVSEVWMSRPLPGARAPGALTGLAVTSRDAVSALTAASSATLWSVRMLWLLIGVVLLMFVAFCWLSMRDLLANANLDGWTGHGLTRAAMLLATRRVVITYIALSAAAIAMLLNAGFPLVLTRSNIDITGAPAVPPLHTNVDPRQLLSLGGAAVALAWLTIALATHTKRESAQSGHR